MEEVARLEGIDLKGGQLDHHFKHRDDVGKEYGLSGSSVGRLIKLNDLILPLRHKLDNDALAVQVGFQLAFLPEEEQEMVYKEMMDLHVKVNIHMAIKLRSQSGKLTRAMVRRYLTKTVEPKDKPMGVKIPATIAKKYLAGKEPKDIEDILCKALEAWFAAEGGGADV